MKKVVVTGGAGFIGSHIIDELVDRKIKVVALDIIKRENALNIIHLLDSKYFQYIEDNTKDLSLLKTIFTGADYIFHHAAIPNPPLDIIDITAYYQNNAQTILNILQSAKNSGVKKVIFASSCAVYGNSKIRKLREDMMPQPISPYAVCKYVAEQYCEIFNAAHSLPTICLRYFNVYGPRQNPDSPLASVIPKFIRAVNMDKSPVIFGDGKQSRDFIYVKDVVNANILAAESKLTGVFNVGTGSNINLNKLLATILTIMNRNDIKPVYKPERSGDIRHSLADINKSISLGFYPRYNLINGLQELLSAPKINTINRKAH
jgi:UDP-glucose 4-epimerase